MRDHKIHFLYDAKKQPDAGFARSLINAFGQTPITEAFNIVSVGGDGALLGALSHATGKSALGVVPPDSNSIGFWTNRNINTPDDLAALLDTAKGYKIRPLKAEITFADGQQIERYGYNEIAIQTVPQELPQALREDFGLSEIDISVQSVLVNMKICIANAILGPARIMGGGLIFSTALGSTALNRAYSGPSIDIRDESIILTGKGISDPVKGFTPIVNNCTTIFELDILSAHKRPTMVTFDSFGINRNARDEPIQTLRISTATDRSVKLILAEDPGRRAYSALGLR